MKGIGMQGAGALGVAPVANVMQYGAKGDGVSDDTRFIQKAINDMTLAGGVVVMPAGRYKITKGLTIDGALRLQGAGGPGDTDGGFGTVAQTRLSYTGTGIAITVRATALQGIKNVHLSDFMLVGGATASGGILIGGEQGNRGPQMVNHSSLKDITVRGFSKPEAYGFCFRRMLTSVIEDCLSVGCYDGFKFPVDASVTTLTLLRCHAYTSVRNGLRAEKPPTISSCQFIGFVAESSKEAGVYLDSAQFLTFYDLYCEGNNVSGGAAPIVIVGTGTHPSRRVNFYNPYIIFNQLAGPRAFDIGRADRCVIFFPTLEAIGTNWCGVTPETTDCVTFMADPLSGSSVTDNAPGRMLVLGKGALDDIASLNHETGDWTPTLSPSTSGRISAGVARGAYTKIGRQVTCTGTVVVASVSAPVGHIVLGGLPFQAGTGHQFNSAVSVMSNNLAVAGATTGYVGNGTKTAFLYKNVNGVASGGAVDVQANSEFHFSFTYFASIA